MSLENINTDFWKKNIRGASFSLMIGFGSCLVRCVPTSIQSPSKDYTIWLLEERLRGELWLRATITQGSRMSSVLRVSINSSPELFNALVVRGYADGVQGIVVNGPSHQLTALVQLYHISLSKPEIRSPNTLVKLEWEWENIMDNNFLT